MSMSNEKISPSALLISSDAALVSSIIKNNSSAQNFIVEGSAASVLSDSSLLNDCGIIIYDIDSADQCPGNAIDQIIALKNTDPTQVLMITGEKESLGEILKSSIQPLVFRAFNKPVNPNIFFLAFKSARFVHEELVNKHAAGDDIMVLAPDLNEAAPDTQRAPRKLKRFVYTSITALVVGVTAYLAVQNDINIEKISDIFNTWSENFQRHDQNDNNSPTPNEIIPEAGVSNGTGEMPN